MSEVVPETDIKLPKKSGTIRGESSPPHVSRDIKAVIAKCFILTTH